ncbi:MAG: lipid A deacylase LpxR family protein [Desulfuromonas sp.]|nr:lipid A deacylase LpxR family protein [Desulfuromonas sp.]
MSLRWSCCWLFVIGLLALPLTASAADEPLGMLSLNVANDSFFNLDRGYSSGLKVEFTPYSAAYTLSIGQDIYTPNERSGEQPPSGEHPYAAWLFGRYEHRIAVSPHFLVTPSLTLGTTGERAQGKEFQDFAHQVLNFDKYEGWDSQVSQRWGWIAELKGEWQLPLIERYGYAVDAIGALEARGGNIQCDAQLGVTLRFGKNLPQLSAERQPAMLSGWYLSAGAAKQVVDKNVFLEGVRSSDYSVEPERTVDHLSCGVHWYHQRWEADLDFYFPTQEFKHQRYNYRYGVVQLSYWF